MSFEDEAQKIELMEWKRVNETRKSSQFKFAAGDDGYGSPECECGEPIPAARREYGYSICVECAADKERKGLRR